MVSFLKLTPRRLRGTHTGKAFNHGTETLNTRALGTKEPDRLISQLSKPKSQEHYPLIRMGVCPVWRGVEWVWKAIFKGLPWLITTY